MYNISARRTTESDYKLNPGTTFFRVWKQELENGRHLT
jgi:hypothetical protein